MRRWSSPISPWAPLNLSHILLHSSPERPMAPKSKSRAQKKPAAKALAAKESKVAQKIPSILKATSRKRIVENHPPVTTPPVTLPTSTSTRVSTRRMRAGAEPVVPTLDKGMSTCYCHSQLTALTGYAAPAAAVSEASRDSSPVESAVESAVESPTETRTVMDSEVAAELASLRGKF